jgi:lipopolysaccharide export system permease protein
VKRLHRLVISSFLGPFVMTFFIVLFLLLMQFLWRYIDELVGKGLEFKIIGELMLYAASSLVPLALPLAILLSSLMTFGNMGEFYELTAMKSSGISLRRIMFPLIILVILISAGAFVFANNVLPVTNLKMKSLLYDVRNQQPGVQITEGVFYNGIANYSIRVNRKDANTNVMYDIKIYDHSSRKGNVVVIIADSGKMKMTADRRNLVVTLWNGYKYEEIDEKKRKKERRFPHEMDKFGEQRIIIEMSGFELMRSDESIFRNSYSMLNLNQLSRAVDSLQKGLDQRSRQFYNTIIRNNYFRMTSRNNLNFNRPDYFSQNQPPPSAAYNANAPVLGNRNLPGEETKAVRRFDPRRVPAGVKKPRVVINDSTKAATPAIKVNNFDSLFNSYSTVMKHGIVRSALNYTSMNQYMVVSTAANLKFDMRYLRRHEIEWHRKFTLSLACLIFLFIGAPLGAIIRKGGLGMPTVISTLLFILYYIMSLTGEKFVRESVLTAFNGMWLSSWILIVAGIFLTYEATNDSAILNFDSYITWIRDKLGLRKSVLLDRKAHLTGKFEIIDIPRKELQDEFTSISKQAVRCGVQLRKEITMLSLARKIISNQGYTNTIEFAVHYNSLIDRIILSQWFRIPYFNKRLTEFPFLNGRLTNNILYKPFIKWGSLIIFPVWIVIYFITWIKFQRMKRSLQLVHELAMGMVNLLNSSAIKTEYEFV